MAGGSSIAERLEADFYFQPLRGFSRRGEVSAFFEETQMLTFFNRSHTESVTVDYCDFLDEALKESVEYLSSSGFKFYCLHPEVANWMGTDVSSVERDSQADQTRSEERDVFVRNQLRESFTLLVSLSIFFRLHPHGWMGFIQRKHCSCFQEECLSFLGKPERGCHGRKKF
ncbi:MAG: hypothetical protein ACLSE8_05275 [Parasutterella sp.]